MLHLSVSILGFILDFSGIWVLCVSFGSQRQHVPSPTPALSSSRSLIPRLHPWTHFSPPHPQPHQLIIPYLACPALAGTQENTYWKGKFIENLESPEFCISSHLILGVTKWLTLTNELWKWKWQYITLGSKLKETVLALLPSSFCQANSSVWNSGYTISMDARVIPMNRAFPDFLWWAGNMGKKQTFVVVSHRVSWCFVCLFLCFLCFFFYTAV